MDYKYKLSICIPTYNREKYLRQLLDSALFQIKDKFIDDVEICVSDNASTDNTQQMIKEYQQKYKNITYFRQTENKGFDTNILKAVDIARGKYCWLFGDDDLMADNAIEQVLFEISNNCDIYISDAFVDCFSIKNRVFKKNIPAGEIFYLKKNNDILHYFNSLNMKLDYGFFGYISIIIVKKEYWKSVKIDPSYIDVTARIHTYIMLSLLKNNITIKHIADCIVINHIACSSGNLVERIRMDFDGFKWLFEKVFSPNLELINFYNILLKQSQSIFAISGAYTKSNKEDRELLLSFTKDFYNKNIIKFLSLFYWIYLKFVKKIFKKIKLHKLLVKLFFVK